MSAVPDSIGVDSAAFDGVASDYDRTFSHRPLGRWLRQSVHRHLVDYAPGDRVLELGCGTGEDALWLAQRGVHVVGIDASAEMLSAAERKIHLAGLTDRVRLQQVDLNAPPGRLHGALSATRFDGCLSNFGALNCVADRAALGATVARLLRPAARLTVVVMGPICAWEIAWFTLQGRLPSACRRFRGPTRARVGDHTLEIDYPSPRRLRRELGQHFLAVGARGLGVLLPPTQLAHIVDRRTRTFERLRSWEDRVAGWPLAAWLGDHYVLELQRHEAER